MTSHHDVAGVVATTAADSQVCKSCLVDKPLAAFAKEKLGILGRRKTCKECRNADLLPTYRATAAHRNKQAAKRREQDLEKFRSRERAWAEQNPDKIAKKNAARAPESREHQRARRMVRLAVQAGKINKPDCCAHCAKTIRLYGHHPDYSKPLDVDWLCASCHRIEHLRLEGKR